MRPKIRQTGPIGVLLAVSLAASACGSTSSASSSKPLGPALANAVAATTAKPPTAATIDEAVTSGGTTSVALGAKDTFSGSAGGYASTVAITATKPVKQSLTLAVAGTTLYVSVPASLKSLVPAGIEYVSVGYSAMLTTLAQSGDAGQVETGLAIAPSALLTMLAKGKITSVKSASGAPAGVTAYSATVTMATGSAPALEAQGIPPVKSARVMIWENKSGLIQRITITATLPGSSGSPKESLTVTSDYSNYGQTTTATSIPGAKVMPESTSTLASVLSTALG